jgi:hypothetical protein
MTLPAQPVAPGNWRTAFYSPNIASYTVHGPTFSLRVMYWRPVR